VLRNNSVCEIVCVFCSETKCLVPTQQHWYSLLYTNNVDVFYVPKGGG
jgi:hypothetical protein